MCVCLCALCCAGHLEEVSTLAAQHDSQVLASASPAFDSTPCEIRIWRLTSGKCSKVGDYTLCSATSSNSRPENVHFTINNNGMALSMFWQ